MAPVESTEGGIGLIVDHIRRHPVVSYTLVAYAISWLGLLAIVGPKFLRGEEMGLSDLGPMGLIMLAGPSIAGLLLTYLNDGRSGLRDLFSRMRRWRTSATWYCIAIGLPPVLIVFTLYSLSILVSPEFTPGLFLFGVVLGLMAGFFEEIGWMGFLYPRLKETRSSLKAAIGLGLIHGVWHLMAAYLGSSQALGLFFVPYFVSMWLIAMTAMRVLQVWVYNSTNQSVLMIQLMHGSSTGFLIALTPLNRSPMIETFWFFIYAIVLWAVVAVVIKRNGTSLKR